MADKRNALMGEMRATPRNALMGTIADALGGVSRFANTPDKEDPSRKANALLAFLSNGLGIGDVAATADRMSYGHDLTRGTGMARQMLPETAGALTAVGPMVAKYPVAAGKLAMGAMNGGADAALGAERAMSLFNLNGLPNGGRDLIRSKADELAERLRREGFAADVQHSGSAAGPSSYLSVSDPVSGGGFHDVRLSGHSKGPANSAGVMDVATPEEFDAVIARAQKLRSAGRPQWAIDKEAENAAKTFSYWSGIGDRAAEKLASGATLSNRERQAIDWLQRNGKALR